MFSRDDPGNDDYFVHRSMRCYTFKKITVVLRNTTSAAVGVGDQSKDFHDPVLRVGNCVVVLVVCPVFRDFGFRIIEHCAHHARSNRVQLLHRLLRGRSFS